MKRQKMIYKTLQRKLKIEQKRTTQKQNGNELGYSRRVDSSCSTVVILLLKIRKFG